MPVNDFEKQVQQKMDELQLRPSGEVWTEVEKRIRKEKQRRRFVLWFFITGLLLLGGIAWWLGNKDHSTDSVAQHKTEGSTGSANDPSNPAADKNNNATGNTTTNNNDINTGTTASQQPVPATNDNSTGNSTDPVTDPVANTTTNNNKKINNKSSTDNSVSASNQGIDVITNQPSVGRKRGNGKDKINDKAIDRVTGPLIATDADKTPVPSQSKPPDAAIQKPVVSKPVTTDKTTINKTTSDQPKADSVLVDSLVVKITDPVIPGNTPSQPTKIKLAKENKWEFGITGGGGVSTTTDGFPIFKVSTEKSLFYDSNVNPNALQGAYPAAYQLVPSDPEEGPYWQIGVYAKRKLSKRIGVSAGLQYSSFSTTQTIGKYIPIRTNISNSAYSSNVQYYYRSGDVATYRNHYNYIQIPVALHWQVNKGKKLPITWQNGITVGHLAKSDALIYTPNSNLFYHDNNLLNKTQLSMQSGLSARLLNKTKHPVSIGFLFNYHFSHLQRVQSNGKDNMTSFGVNASWIIKK